MPLSCFAFDFFFVCVSPNTVCKAPVGVWTLNEAIKSTKHTTRLKYEWCFVILVVNTGSPTTMQGRSS